MTKITIWDPQVGERPANLALTNNYTATTNPGVGNDSAHGYSAGSVWINTATNPDSVFICSSAAVGAAVWQSVADGSAAGQVIAPDASTPTGNGSAGLLRGGAGGSTSGNGGQAQLTGGAATAGNGNGGSAVIVPGAKNGTGKDGSVIERSNSGYLRKYTVAAKTVAAVLTAAELIGGMLTANQGGGAAANYQLPLSADLDTAMPDAAAGDAIDFTLTNISTVAAEDITITTNTGWTALRGNMVVASNAAATDQSVGTFRALKTGAGDWSLYRIA